jgi:type IV secretion system protein TrbB
MTAVIMGPNEAREVKGVLTWATGPEALAALKSPDTLEVMVNSDGRLWIETHRDGKQPGKDVFTPERLHLMVSLCAHVEGIPVGTSVSADFPLTGDRFQAGLSTVNGVPSITIRKHSEQVIPFKAWIESGRISRNHARLLSAAIRTGSSIVLAGKTGSGKTTLLNSMANEIDQRERVISIEDRRELRLPNLPDHESFITRKGETTILSLVRDAMRQRPDRIIIGEARDGETLLEALKSGRTGHQGLLLTIHAGSAAEALERMEDLLNEAAHPSPKKLIAGTVGVLVFLKDKRVIEVRRMKECVRQGYGK